MTGTYGISRLAWLGAAGLLAACGCQFGGSAPFHADPLLHERAATLSSFSDSAHVSLPLQQPLVPNPPVIPAAVPAPALPVAPADAPVEGGEPLPAPRPLSEPEPEPAPTILPPEVADAPVEPRIHEAVSTVVADPLVSQTYAADPDYRWLQGVIDRHYSGHANLRYCPPSEDDRWGGKVHLLPHPELERFRNGDVIRIEGELLPGVAPEGLEGRADYPGYRIRSVSGVGGAGPATE